jgi:hypothetical protein
MTEGTSNDAAPEAVRLDVDPGRNVGTAELAAGPAATPTQPTRAEARQNAQAAQRHAAAPPSYHGPERTTERPWPAIALGVVAVAVIVAAIVLYWV